MAHLLLARRRISRCRKKCCFTRWPKIGCESIDAGGQSHAKALRYVACNEKLMHLTQVLPIQTTKKLKIKTRSDRDQEGEENAVQIQRNHAKKA
jgi:hypothetical protein